MQDGKMKHLTHSLMSKRKDEIEEDKHGDILHAGQPGIYRICGQTHLFWHPINDKKWFVQKQTHTY